MRDVHVFGDSHWRVFFPFVNHGSPGVTFEKQGVRMVDMVANELSGATMYGLLNPESKNGARRRILGDLDRIGPVENVALVFGEVDIRYHREHYVTNGLIDDRSVIETVLRYKRFIEHDLIDSGRVTGHVFVYFGFAYPQRGQTLLQPDVPMGDDAFEVSHILIGCFEEFVRKLIPNARSGVQVHVIALSPYEVYESVSGDGVHLVPHEVFPWIFRQIREHLDA